MRPRPPKLSGRCAVVRAGGERSGVKQSGEAVCHGSVVVLSILGGIKGRKHPQ